MNEKVIYLFLKYLKLVFLCCCFVVLIVFIPYCFTNFYIFKIVYTNNTFIFFFSHSSHVYFICSVIYALNTHQRNMLIYSVWHEYIFQTITVISTHNSTRISITTESLDRFKNKISTSYLKMNSVYIEYTVIVWVVHYIFVSYFWVVNKVININSTLYFLVLDYMNYTSTIPIWHFYILMSILVIFHHVATKNITFWKEAQGLSI